MAKKKVIQRHHWCYSPELTQDMTRGEHWLCTKLFRYKYCSKGFLRTLKLFIILREDTAEEVHRK